MEFICYAFSHHEDWNIEREFDDTKNNIYMNLGNCNEYIHAKLLLFILNFFGHSFFIKPCLFAL